VTFIWLALPGWATFIGIWFCNDRRMMHHPFWIACCYFQWLLKFESFELETFIRLPFQLRRSLGMNRIRLRWFDDETGRFGKDQCHPKCYQCCWPSSCSSFQTDASAEFEAENVSQRSSDNFWESEDDRENVSMEESNTARQFCPHGTWIKIRSEERSEGWHDILFVWNAPLIGSCLGRTQRRPGKLGLINWDVAPTGIRIALELKEALKCWDPLNWDATGWLFGYCIGKESSVQIISIFALSAGKGFHTVEFLFKNRNIKEIKAWSLLTLPRKGYCGTNFWINFCTTSGQALCPKGSSLTHSDAKDTLRRKIWYLFFGRYVGR